MPRFLAAERYVLAVLLATQRWAAPALVLVGLIAWIWATPPVGRPTVRITLVALFALAAWLGHATGTCEESGQELISASCSGGHTRVLLAKWVTAVAVAVVVPVVVLACTWAYDAVVRPLDPPRFADGAAAAAALGMLAVAVAGAALGLLVSSLLPGRPGWVAGCLLVLSLAQAAPWMLPVPAVSGSLPEGVGSTIVPVVLPSMLSVLLGAALFAAARLLRRPVR